MLSLPINDLKILTRYYSYIFFLCCIAEVFSFSCAAFPQWEGTGRKKKSSLSLGICFKKALENRTDGQDFETSLTMKTLSTYCFYVYNRPAKNSPAFKGGKKHILTIFTTPGSIFSSSINDRKEAVFHAVLTFLIKILMIENKII